MSDQPKYMLNAAREEGDSIRVETTGYDTLAEAVAAAFALYDRDDGRPGSIHRTNFARAEVFSAHELRAAWLARQGTVLLDEERARRGAEAHAEAWEALGRRYKTAHTRPAAQVVDVRISSPVTEAELQRIQQQLARSHLAPETRDGQDPEIRIVEGEISAVRLQPGDVVVLMHPGRLSAAAVRHLREAFEPLFPDNEVAVLEEGMRLGVVERIDNPDPAGGAG